MMQQSSKCSKEPSSKASDPSQGNLKIHLRLIRHFFTALPDGRAVSYYIAKDMLPLDIVSGEGFLRMVKEFEPRYNPPGRKALTTHYLPRLYQQQLDQVKASLSDLRYSTSFAMTIMSCK